MRQRLLSGLLRRLRPGHRDAAQVGLQLLPDGIALAVVRRGNGGPRLVHCGHTACAPDPEARRAALRSAVREHSLAGLPTVIVMERDAYQLLQIEAPAVPPDELRAAVRWQIRDLLDYHIDDAVIDVFDVPGDERPGRPMYAVAARLETVRERVELAEAAELALCAIDIPELALRNVACLLPEAAEGMALVRLLADEGLILLVRDGALHLARNVEFGVAAGLAELPERLALEVQRSLDYYDSTFRQAPVTRVALAPFDGPVDAMAEHLHEALGLTVARLDLDGILTPAEPVPPALQAVVLEATGGALRTEERTL